MSKAVCSECQFLYDSRFGLPEDGISRGTSFGIIDDSTFYCPQCGASKDMFLDIQETPVEVDDAKDLTEMEMEHVPTYFFQDEDLVVRVGSLGVEHPQEADHMIEWIEIRDTLGETVDRVYFGEVDTIIEARFAVDSDEEFGVYASCSEHGIWKGIPHESTGL